MKKKLAMLTIVAGLCLMVFGFYRHVESYKVPMDDRAPAIIRLHDAEGRFFCSGSVIDAQTIVTAAHCLAWMPVNYTFQIHSQDGTVIVPVGKVRYNERADVGVIFGNFRQFKTMQIETNPTAIMQTLKRNNMQLCGYPWGGKLFCSSYKYIGNFLSQFQGEGKGWPGMSGGPVIDNDTGKIVAVLLGTTETNIVVNPLVEMYDLLGL